MRKSIGVTLVVVCIVSLLVGCLVLVGCGNKAKEQNQTFKAILDSYLLKDVAISMWNSEKSKPATSTWTVAEVNADYLVAKIMEEKGEKKIAIPISNITSIVLTDAPPTLVLNDQTLLSGFGETIDNVGYVGNRISQIGKSAKASDQIGKSAKSGE
jgi:hypothetical protein